MTAACAVIDARGMRCPWPALRLARAIRAGAGDVEVIADDPIARGELAAVAQAHGLQIRSIDTHRFLIVAA